MNHVEPQQAPPDDLVYVLVPHAAGYQVMKAPLLRLLEISEAVCQEQHRAPEPATFHDCTPAEDGNTVAPPRTANPGLTFAQILCNNEWGSATGSIHLGDAEIDTAARRVSRSGIQTSLTPAELNLLVALLRRNGAATTSTELMRAIGTSKAGTGSKVLHTHVRNLRRKLERDPSHPAHLLTVSRFGYRLRM